MSTTDNSTMTDNSIQTDNSTMTDDIASDAATDAASDAASDANSDNVSNEDIANFNATNVYAIIATQNVRPISAAHKALIKFMASKK